jgi:prepilin-type N-terminal cleavage/methylation domain-containing protein
MHLRPETSSARAAQLGFTLVEVLVATALLGLVAGGAIWALTQANNYASVSRLYTGAETVAQNQIDYLLTDSPFNPQSDQWGSTNEWKEGTVQVTPSDANPPKIYSEPDKNGNFTHVIYGTLTTTVQKVSNVKNVPDDETLYSATVTVTYTFRGKDYRVQLNAMRAPDV